MSSPTPVVGQSKATCLFADDARLVGRIRQPQPVGLPAPAGLLPRTRAPGVRHLRVSRIRLAVQNRLNLPVRPAIGTIDRAD